MDIERVNKIVQTDKPKIETEEIPSMKTAMKNFVLYRWIEICLIVVGVILYFLLPIATFWKGC